MRYWLMKSEPSSFSLEDLKACPQQTTMWDGVRNYQARNFLRDEFKRGDQAFFYHSSCAEPGIVAIVEVVKEAHPDPTALDPENHHYDPRAQPDSPRWFVVDVTLKRALRRTIGLAELKAHEKLAGMRLLAPGNRLSVMPVSAEEWRYILALE